MHAATHPRQQERLARLHQYEILDTPRESDFDDIVQLASQICETPISVVNLIDRDRQWFKAEVGLGVRETPLETSLCSHAILEQDYMEIPDTLDDARTSDNPLCAVTDGLRFYAGFLLKSDDGLPVGTLCVLDTKPRQLSDNQRNALRVLARQVTHQLDLRLALSRQELMRKEIDHRVKNSLQTIAAYVRQRGRLSQSAEARETLSAVTTRIEAVAALHKQFYSGDTGLLDLAELGERLDDITSEICPDGVDLEIGLPSVAVNATTASALSMIVSEFIGNSIKHAFTDRSKGVIQIAGVRLLDGRIHIICRDDGVGTESDFGKRSGSAGLGIRIIEAGIAQLRSVPIWRSGSGGTELSFAFDNGQ